MTYSLDFRKRVLSIRDKEKLSFISVGKRFGVCAQSVFRWSKKLEPKRTRNKPPTKIDMNALKEDVEKYPDGYIQERAERLGVSKSGIWWTLKCLKITYKKNAKSSQSMPQKTKIFPRKNS